MLKMKDRMSTNSKLIRLSKKLKKRSRRGRMRERSFKFRSKSRTFKPSQLMQMIRNRRRTKLLQESQISTLKRLYKTHSLMTKMTMVTSKRKNQRSIS